MDLLDWKSRSHANQQVRDLLQQGELDGAIRIVEQFIAQSGDDTLIEAARCAAAKADVDWVGVSAESIEADCRLRSLQETGCRRVVLSLGNQSNSRLRIVRQYYGPPRIREAGGRPEPWLGESRGILKEVMEVAGLEKLAAVQLRSWPRDAGEQRVEERTKMLAGHLLVLRFFGAAQRNAAKSGLPVPAQLQVQVEAPLGGEDALTQLEPRLEMEIPCSVRPISVEVEQRLKQRYEVHLIEWHEATEKLLHNLRTEFKSRGYAPSFMLPNELGETKERFRTLERRLMHLNPFHRLTARGFEALAAEIRAARDRSAPAPIDPAPYR